MVQPLSQEFKAGLRLPFTSYIYPRDKTSWVTQNADNALLAGWALDFFGVWTWSVEVLQCLPHLMESCCPVIVHVCILPSSPSTSERVAQAT